MNEKIAPEWRCDYCGSEVGAFELFDGRLIGFGCIRSALREADTAPPDAQSFEERWRHLHLGRGEA